MDALGINHSYRFELPAQRTLSKSGTLHTIQAQGRAQGRSVPRAAAFGAFDLARALIPQGYLAPGEEPKRGQSNAVGLWELISTRGVPTSLHYVTQTHCGLHAHLKHTHQQLIAGDLCGANMQIWSPRMLNVRAKHP